MRSPDAVSGVGAPALAAGSRSRRSASAQGLDPATLLKPPADSWPTYHGDYTGQRHSRLTQITPENVHQLTLAWTFQTGQPEQIKASPILVNGVIYITTPDNIWAIDARIGTAALALHLSGEQGLPHRPSRRGGLQGHRLPDDARLRTWSRSTRKNGKVKWDVDDRRLEARATGRRTRR